MLSSYTCPRQWYYFFCFTPLYTRVWHFDTIDSFSTKVLQFLNHRDDFFVRPFTGPLYIFGNWIMEFELIWIVTISSWLHIHIANFNLSDNPLTCYKCIWGFGDIIVIFEDDDAQSKEFVVYSVEDYDVEFSPDIVPLEVLPVEDANSQAVDFVPDTVILDVVLFEDAVVLSEDAVPVEYYDAQAIYFVLYSVEFALEVIPVE